MKKNNKSAIILLSGGLDSAVSIAASNCNIKLGLLFNYGQNSFRQEKKASVKLSEYYGFPLKIIGLNWLKEIVNNGLTSSEKLITLKTIDNEKDLCNSMKSVWVPNRNALFINIAAAYCESYDVEKIIIGANKEEGKTFKDNTKAFVQNCNKMLNFSTNSCVEVVAPLINKNKDEIVSLAIKYNVPLKNIYSCYKGNTRHCGECESCMHLKKALKNNCLEDLIKKLF